MTKYLLKYAIRRWTQRKIQSLQYRYDTIITKIQRSHGYTHKYVELAAYKIGKKSSREQELAVGRDVNETRHLKAKAEARGSRPRPRTRPK